jgi:hypothetical protein
MLRGIKTSNIELKTLFFDLILVALRVRLTNPRAGRGINHARPEIGGSGRREGGHEFVGVHIKMVLTHLGNEYSLR